MERLNFDEIEFYVIGDDVWYLKPDGSNVRLDDRDQDMISMLIDRIIEFYPDSYKALEEWYSKTSANVRYFRYLIARRFVKCNFGRLDTTKNDVSGMSLQFEKVDCPMRGECKLEGVVCLPKFNSTLSEAELRVMKLFYEGLSKEEIAERLYLSVNTVKNHIKASYVKIGIHEKSEFVIYAERNNLFR